MIERVVCWFSCGVTSAIATKLAIDKYKNKYPIVVVYIDTGSEHEDNFRFLRDVEQWLGLEILVLKNPEYEDTFDVYKKTRFLVGKNLAKCSIELKKKVRQEFENLDADLQVFGFDAKEFKRAKRFVADNPLGNFEFPLIDCVLTKDDCHDILQKAGIKRPITYDLGFQNANCLKRGCVKGGLGYWNHYRKIFPEQYDEMAAMEREIGIAINKVRSKGKEDTYVFLDELDPNLGRHDTDLNPQCGLFCGQYGDNND